VQSGSDSGCWMVRKELPDDRKVRPIRPIRPFPGCFSYARAHMEKTSKQGSNPLEPSNLHKAGRSHRGTGRPAMSHTGGEAERRAVAVAGKSAAQWAVAGGGGCAHPKNARACDMGFLVMRRIVHRARLRCGARCRDGHLCRAPAVWDYAADEPKNGRCRMHGGLSTGPRTREGLARLRPPRPPLPQEIKAAVLAARQRGGSYRQAGASVGASATSVWRWWRRQQAVSVGQRGERRPPRLFTERRQHK